MTDWKPFPGLEDKYEISSDFRLRKTKDETMATVKPLEWKSLGKSFEAITPVGEFYAQHYSEIDGEGWTALYSEVTEIGDFPTAEDAKAASQADYERRVLACIA